jgi:hypothetical protein
MKQIGCLVIYGTGTRGLRIAVHAQKLIFLSVSFRTRLTSIRCRLVSIGLLIKGFIHCRILPVL